MSETWTKDDKVRWGADYVYPLFTDNVAEAIWFENEERREQFLANATLLHDAIEALRGLREAEWMVTPDWSGSMAREEVLAEADAIIDRITKRDAGKEA